MNILDTPGYRPFLNDTRLALRVADAAIVVVDAVSGVEVQTEKVWEFAEEFSLPRLVVVNKLDRDNASFERALESLGEVFGRAPIPIQLPIGSEREFTGVVNIIRNKAYRFERDGSGKFKETDVPAEMTGAVQQARERLIERVAETSDALMEKFFAEGTLEGDDLISGFRKGVGDRSIIPIVCTSATLNIGVVQLLDAVADGLPAPTERGHVEGVNPKTKQPEQRPISSQAPMSAYVFKTVADPFTGRISLIRVYSGVMRSDTTYANQTKERTEKVGPLQLALGKTLTAIGEVHAGDLVAVAKLKETTTGDTLCDPAHPILYAAVEIPEPSITFAIEPKSRGDEDKIATALHRIIEEDPTHQVPPGPPDQAAPARGQRPAPRRGRRGEAAQELSASRSC